jgi:hypothetical protein
VYVYHAVNAIGMAAVKNSIYLPAAGLFQRMYTMSGDIKYSCMSDARYHVWIMHCKQKTAIVQL